MENNLVSIIIPTFNRADLLVEAVQSVLRQSYADFELIIVDDGSSDDTESKIAAFSSEKITYIKQQHRGAGYARNCGLKHARCKYVAFLDSDDFWLDFKLQLQVDIMERFPDLAFLCTDFYILKEDDRRIPNGLATWFHESLDIRKIYQKKYKAYEVGISCENINRNLTIYSGNIYNSLLHYPCVLPSTSIVRRSFLSSSINFAEDLLMYEDWVFFAKLSRDYDAAFLDLECAVNRGHNDPYRLTLADGLTKSRCRLKLIDYVWENDRTFKDKHGCEIKRVCHKEHISAIKYCLLEGGNGAARKILAELKSHSNFSFQGWILLWALLMYIPLTPHLLRGLRSIKRRLATDKLGSSEPV